jgi:hypothetical protein
VRRFVVRFLDAFRGDAAGFLSHPGGVTGSFAGGGGILPNFFRSEGASPTTQRTLTVIVKFAEDQRVQDFAYRQSSF